MYIVHVTVEYFYILIPTHKKYITNSSYNNLLLFRYTHKTSGFKTSGFKTFGFKTSETSGLQNVRFTKC